MKGGLTPLFRAKDVDAWFSHFTDRAEEKLHKTLIRAGEMFARYARLYGNYDDHTGNLRSSIGYVIVKDGNVVNENIKFSEKKGTDKATGVREARKLTRILARMYDKGLVLICVAGMNYAASVEAMESKDVVTAAGIKTNEDLKKQLTKIFAKING